MSDVQVRPSLIARAGMGLFTARAFRLGEVITLSPTVVLPMHVLRSTMTSSVLWNYCISSPASSVALLPIAYISMANHNSNASAHLEWFSWKSGAATLLYPEDLSSPLSDLLLAPFAPLDLALVASRDIAEGEEILLDYGASWSQALHSHRSLKSAQQSPPVPPFRAMIAVDDSFFPASWLTTSGSSLDL